MVKLPKEIFTRYGSDVRNITAESETRFQAFLQPMRRRYQNYYVPKRHLTGVFTNDHYLLIAPPDTSLSRGDELECNSLLYTVISTDSYYVKDNVLYVWAVLTAHTERTEDDLYD